MANIVAPNNISNPGDVAISAPNTTNSILSVSTNLPLVSSLADYSSLQPTIIHQTISVLAQPIVLVPSGSGGSYAY